MSPSLASPEALTAAPVTGSTGISEQPRQALGTIALQLVSEGRARKPYPLVVVLALSLLLIGCGPTLQVAQGEVEQKWLAYFKDGNTTKEEVLLRLGLPAAQFEGERILTYRLMLTDAEGLVVVPRKLDPRDPRLSYWARGQYSLVLVFDGKHILQRHILLRVR